jgi:hypothetical protein
MNEETMKMFSRLIDGLESLWTENLAMQHLLEHYKIPGWMESMLEYRERQSSKDRAHAKFAPYRSLIQAAHSDSKALESLLAALPTKGKAN